MMLENDINYKKKHIFNKLSSFLILENSLM